MIELAEHLPDTFSPQSRVWIYQSSRIFTMTEALHLEKMFEDFVVQWHTHGAKVQGFASLFFGQFIILMADETGSKVSGCSTDSSVKMIREIEKLYSVNLLDRQLLAFYIKNKVQLIPMNQLQPAIASSLITADTTYFNNTVLTKAELQTNWMIPIKNSWIAKKFPESVA